jgi:acylphosphatase
MKADNVVVTGLVQGVGFRWSARRAAERIGVRGWVRNRADGSVELHVEGDEERVAAMLAWLRRGPDGAVIREVEVVETATEDLERFEIRI